MHKIKQEVIRVAYSERELLARIAQCEAGGEGDNGMKAALTVVINRVRIFKSITRWKYKKYNFSTRTI